MVAFSDGLPVLIKQIRDMKGLIQTEEGANNFFSMQFISNVFDSGIFDVSEVVSESICDVGMKCGVGID
ncbi:hypothetical protein MUBE_14360 [Mycobacterium uberis]|uniref:Uncharacterized protein n=1 Tax=Mycobacterium uberis TaxID=2162698 RepID=A0A3E1HCC1_9MYCO|nr:hypothetical protein MUBE_14360 [Mycobacterium uberis]